MTSDNRLIGSKNIQWARELYAENQLHKQLLQDLITYIGASCEPTLGFVNHLIKMCDVINDMDESPVVYEWNIKQKELKDYE